MKNTHCILCTQLHNNHYIEIKEENRKGLACAPCYDIKMQEDQLCFMCNTWVPCKEFISSYSDLNFEECCNDCAQDVISEHCSKYEGL